MTRRRGRATLWLGAGAVLVLLAHGVVSGTLAGWVDARVDNASGAQSTAGVILRQDAVGGDAGACWSSVNTANSNSTCTNKLFLDLSVAPGATASKLVKFSNVGAAHGRTFTVTPGGCTPTPAPTNLCNYTESSYAAYGAASPAISGLKVSMACGPTSTGLTWATPKYTTVSAATLQAASAQTHTVTGTLSSGDLRSGASWYCQFSWVLDRNTDPAYAGTSIRLDLTWSLAT
ncbi:hypothetical protein [Nocardioides sp. YIM 152588]|uniref:hypothetical protein n=1 Tax=Nocardioides sp. YIM 152588 TaxID=3158259 RepID=UPI0032E51B2B